VLYAWVKALHIISVIAWMAGMLYLPRLFVYHAEVPTGSPQSETFKVMERRLLKAIMTPAMMATWIFGLWLAVEGGWFRSGWLYGKLGLVIALSGLHGYLAATIRRFANDANTRNPRFYRVLNEVPTVIMIGIVILVVVKPF
jgi:protoporphyrinogen IX oxidase